MAITNISEVSIELWYVEPLQVNRFLCFAEEGLLRWGLFGLEVRFATLYF